MLFSSSSYVPHVQPITSSTTSSTDNTRSGLRIRKALITPATHKAHTELRQASEQQPCHSCCCSVQYKCKLHCYCGLRCPGVLFGQAWYFLTDVSGHPIGPISVGIQYNGELWRMSLHLGEACCWGDSVLCLLAGVHYGAIWVLTL